MTFTQGLRQVTARITAALTGLGLLGGAFWPGGAAAAYKTVPEEYEEVPVSLVQSGPTLLFSDSPEMVYETGILYKDTITGEGRVFFHHVNGTKERLKLAVLMRPAGKPASVTWGCRGIGEPNEDYFKTARQSQQRYFSEYKANWELAQKQAAQRAAKGEAATKERKAAGKKEDAAAPDYSFYAVNKKLPLTMLGRGEYSEVLTRSRNACKAGIILKPEQLLTGMFDFYSKRPVEIVVLMCRPDDDIAKFSSTAKILPMDEHPLRGTYANADLTYRVKSPVRLGRGQSAALALGSSERSDYLWGTDAITGTKTENYGNYGVVYHVLYEAEGEDPISLGINPWGGNFSGAGALITASGLELQDLPSRGLYFGRGDEVDEIIRQDPRKEKAEGEFIWSPPGASNLPVRLFWTAEDRFEKIWKTGRRAAELRKPVDTDSKLEGWLTVVRERRKKAGLTDDH